ncbi:MAG: hypothetical protein AAFY16_05980, partial [Cyanobacteria bacterium J06642_3]
MKLLLKTLLQRRARDEGFTLPMVIALGLVMVLLGTANIVKSSEENLNATIQNSSSDALAIAEVGITKYREFLNQNRILAVYNHDVWDSNDVDITVNGIPIEGIDVAGQTCIDMTGAPAGWTGTATKPNDTAAEASDKDTNDNDNWWAIREDMNGDGDTDDPEDLIGEYRLVSYTYDNDNDLSTNDNGDFNNLVDANTDDDSATLAAGVTPGSITDENDTDDDGESDARGILKVQGRSPDGSVAQIQVDIPLRINQDEMQNLAPALWIGDGNGANLGTLNLPSFDPSVPDSFPSNIVLKDSASGCSDPADITGIDSDLVISDARGIPLLSSIAAKIDEAEKAGSINTALPPASQKLGNLSANPFVTPDSGSFDAATDCKDISNCRYYYKLNATDITNVRETDGIAKVTPLAIRFLSILRFPLTYRV